MEIRTGRIGAVLIRAVLFGVLVAGSVACGGDCAGVGQPAFEITVVDDATGRAAARGATAYVFSLPDYSLVDAVVAEDTLRVRAAWDREGLFDVLVEKDGYWPWTRNSVMVETHSGCTTKTVHLTARLRLRTRSAPEKRLTDGVAEAAARSNPSRQQSRHRGRVKSGIAQPGRSG